jgi:hypothetical protein
MNTGIIDFGDEPAAAAAVPPTGAPAASAEAGAGVALEVIEGVLAKLSQAELADLLDGIKRKIDGTPAIERASDQASERDSMAEANVLRQDAARELDRITWVSGTGERFPLKLTSSRYSTYEWLRRWRRGTNAPAYISENEALASRYLDAGLFIFLCATAPAVRTAEEEMAAAADWMDLHIPLGRQDESLRVANRIMDLTDLFVPVPRKSAEEVEEDGEAAAEKKTRVRAGNRDTWPSSASV